MGCCGTKEQSNHKKAIYEVKGKQTEQKHNIKDEGNRVQTEENKTTINTDNKHKNEVQNNGKVDLVQQSKINDNTPTPAKGSNIQASINNQTINANQIQSQLGQNKNISAIKDNNPDIRKVGSFGIKYDENAIKLSGQENVDPNSLKGQSQNLSKQQMRISKVDRNTTSSNEQQIDKSKGEYDDYTNEPVSNMIQYSQQHTFQNKGMKDNIVNKHMRSILNSLKTNDSASKSCYSTPPILNVDTDSHNKGEWMQVETFGTYGQAQKQEYDNFMDD